VHDIGHGPYSHTLEHYLIRDFHHEQMSRRLLVRLIERLADHPQAKALRLALQIFDGTYERAFFHRLVASQLDMDRLDYLRRDAFYTGVAEGEVGVERLLKTLRVVPGRAAETHVAVEAKGIYAVENFLISRRLMYWQVYLHKTVLAGDELLRAAFRRVRWHFREGRGALAEGCSPALCFFLQNAVTADDLEQRPAITDHYAALDDTDVLFSLKQWKRAATMHDDPVLADLARRFLNRDFFRVTFLADPPSDQQMSRWRTQVAAWLRENGLALDRSRHASFEEAARYYLTLGRSRHSTYRPGGGEAIGILGRGGQVRELSEVADTSALTALSERVVKPYLCYPKEVDLDLDGA
jgi:HD superfamily phosphohydrolase